MSIVASGSVPSNPSELLSGPRCREALQRLSRQFDFVIVDSAPVLPVSDALALSQAVDGVLFVAQAKRTSRRQVAEALERLERVQAPESLTDNREAE